MTFDLTLTFDNGPHPEVTPRVLSALSRRGLRTTFFVIGQKLATREGRRLAERAHADGHAIGNHTFTHTTPLGLLREEGRAADEIRRTQEAIGALAHPSKFFRPMGGGGTLDTRLLNREAAEVLQAERFTCVLWNAIPRDWNDPEGWTERALAQLRQQPWTLMVVHDIPGAAAGRLERFLDEAEAMGARFRQDFPPACLPIVEGRPALPLAPYVAAHAKAMD